MLNYAFFCSSAPHWLELGLSLKENAIAEPTFWFGDDLLYEDAKDYFGSSNVYSLVQFRYNLDVLKLYNINHKDTSFLFSNNYSRAKDICMKMMDRLDDAGLFSRLDRELWVNKMASFGLHEIENKNIDFVLMTEAPHNHAQYMMYEIFKFKNIPIFKFNPILPIPALYLVNDETEEKIATTYQYDSILFNQFRDKLNRFINQINDSKNLDYQPLHMKIQLDDTFRISKKIMRALKYIKDDTKTFIKKLISSNPYRSSNPYYFNPYLIRYLAYKRGKQLKHNEQINLSASCDRKYVYFPIHYEPERTTTPDGGEYHDQIKAILDLRRWLPEHLELIVKEHPSQFLPVRDGYKGRSPLFYNMISCLKGVTLLDTKTSSKDLINNAELIFVISGTVAIEAAVLGKKAIVIADTWFSTLPNIYRWNKDMNYDDFFERQIKSSDIILEHLIKFINQHSIPAFQNLSSDKRYSESLNDLFYDEQQKALYLTVKSLCDNLCNS